MDRLLEAMNALAVDQGRTEKFLRDHRLHGPNFDETPQRVARMWQTFFHPEPVTLTTFPLQHKGGMILIKNHEAWGFCPHHLLPVHYTFKIGYVPEDMVLGLSKLARIADASLSDMPLQEDIPERIAAKIISAINPKGVGIIVAGEHLCMRMRGVESPCAEAVSTFMWGVFLELDSTREEFISL